MIRIFLSLAKGRIKVGKTSPVIAEMRSTTFSLRCKEYLQFQTVKIIFNKQATSSTVDI
jgi:hypothetical protein